VKVYAGVDQLTGKKMWLRETVSAREARKETEREACKVLTRLLNQVDERRQPRTGATVNERLDRWLEVLDVERKTRAGYVSKIEKHIMPTLGKVPVGRVEVESVERLYARSFGDAVITAKDGSLSLIAPIASMFAMSIRLNGNVQRSRPVTRRRHVSGASECAPPTAASRLPRGASGLSMQS